MRALEGLKPARTLLNLLLVSLMIYIAEGVGDAPEQIHISSTGGLAVQLASLLLVY